MVALVPPLEAADFRFSQLWPQLPESWHFYYPEGIAVASNGDVYVVDTQNNRIQVLDSHGRFLRTWGAKDQIGSGTDPNKLNAPRGLALYEESDLLGNKVVMRVYVADTDNKRIQVFDSLGKFERGWGKVDENGVPTHGTGDGEFNFPACIAVDKDENIYVTDMGNHRVQVFNNLGEFVRKWGSSGTEPGKFASPVGIVIGADERVYVADHNNNRIMSFDKTGGSPRVFWADAATASQSYPGYIAFDGQGNLYVTDSDLNGTGDAQNDRILVLNSQGGLLRTIGKFGTGPKEFSTVHGVAAGTDGQLYITDAGNNRIQVLDKNDNFLQQWRGDGSEAGWFKEAGGVVADKADNIYVADKLNSRIQVFDSQGNFLQAWLKGVGGPAFGHLSGLAMDSAEHLYVMDRGSNRLHILSKEGLYLGGLSGDLGASYGTFGSPEGIALDSSNHIYVADTGNNRVLVFDAVRFDAQGNVVPDSLTAVNALTGYKDASKTWWNLKAPLSVAVDSGGRVYVTDQTIGDGISSHRVVVFKPVFDVDGKPIEALNISTYYVIGEGDKKLELPSAISIDSNNNVYIADVGRVQVFRPNTAGTGLEFVTSLGMYGSLASEFNKPSGLLADATNKRLLVADAGNSRVQVFDMDVPRPGEALERAGAAAPPRALIIGGFIDGSYGNGMAIALRDAYAAIKAQGYRNEAGNKEIKILWNISDAVLKGLKDDAGAAIVEGVDLTDFSISNPPSALTKWATDGSRLLVYMVGHGNDKAFYLDGSGSTSTKVLTAEVLGNWLNEVQTSLGSGADNDITVIYDACHSGSFLAKLTNKDKDNRVLMTSASSSQTARFSYDGIVSYSYGFWSGILRGNYLKTAHDTAAIQIGAMTQNEQIPQLETNGNGFANETDDYNHINERCIGVRLSASGGRTRGCVRPNEQVFDANNIDPVIIWAAPGKILTGQEKTAELELKVDATDAENIKEAWAIVTPPVDVREGAFVKAESVGLSLRSGNNPDPRFRIGSYNGFDKSGRYSIAYYVRYNNGNVSIPLLGSVTKINENNLGKDNYETDNEFGQAGLILALHPSSIRNLSSLPAALQGREIPQIHTIHDQADVDWVKFLASPNRTYEIKASPQSQTLDLYIEIYSNNGGVALGNSGNSNGPGVVETLNHTWTGTEPAMLQVRITAINNTATTAQAYELYVYEPNINFPGLISGSVKDSDGNALSNVIITTSGSQNAVPLSDGNYVMSHQSGETFTVTATDRDTGLSQTQTVTVNELGVAELNFVIPKAPDDPEIPPDTTPPPDDTPVALPPSAQTIAASDITLTTATLNGQINGNGTVSLVYFDFGPNTSYGITIAASPSNVQNAATVTGKATGLTCNTTYHYRVTATNIAGTTNGENRSFTTQKCGELESPKVDTFASGIGLIRGWHCQASKIEIQIDTLERMRVASGTSRDDTKEKCGDSNNGFGLTYNFNLLSNGRHTLKAFADDKEFASTSFTVTTLGAEYLRGASGEFPVANFPQAGKTVRVRWSEPHQGFMLVSAAKSMPNTLGIAPVQPKTGVVASLESPAPNSFESGVALIRGWVCAANKIEIKINDRAPMEAGYGTPRDDTKGTCGDNNNGFGLIFNWNLLGDGTHTVKAFADGVEFGSATFTVTTLGQEYLTGVSGGASLANFPTAGKTTKIQWAEPQQNFVIVP